MPKDNILSRFTGLSSELELVRALEKGDFQGHPFRGNQWANSSGASTAGGETSSTSPSDQTLRTIAEDINSKLDVLMADGARFVQFSGGIDFADRKAYIDQLPMVSLATPQARLIANGVAMTEEAINDEANIVVIEDKQGTISGAISMTEKPYTPQQVSSRFFEAVDKESPWVEMRSAGSTMTIDGIGSALFAAAINKASESGSGLFLVPLDENAKQFWNSKGFRVVEQEKTLGRTATTFQYLDAQSVQTIYDNLEEVF
jgi:hypothetical protein